MQQHSHRFFVLFCVFIPEWLSALEHDAQGSLGLAALAGVSPHHATGDRPGQEALCSRRCVYAGVCVGGGGLRSAHYVAKKNNKRKTKRKETEEKNQKVDAQFVFGAPLTRCACGCMSGWVNLRLPATVDEPLTSARSQKKKKGRGGVAMISERRVRMLQHASFSPASCTFFYSLSGWE